MSPLAYQYQAIDRSGSRTRGTLRAEDREDAFRQLTAGGMRPLRIVARRQRNRNKRVTTKDLAYFTHQFSVLLQARISLIDGLRSLAEQERNDKLRAVIIDIAAQVEVGSSIFDAMVPHRRIFGDVYVAMIQTAEKSGNLIEVLEQLARMLERQTEINRTVRGAMMYPICVVGAIVLAMTFLMIFVIPRFGSMFASRGLDLPIPTQMVMGASGFVSEYWYVLLVVIGAIAFGLRSGMRNDQFRQRFDGWLHRVPYLNRILRGLAIGRFMNTLGLSLRSGLSLIDAIDMSGQACGRPLLEKEAEKLKNHVNVGGRLSDVIFTCQYLPAFTQRMVAAGEETGELPRMCEVITTDLDREVMHLTRNLTTFIEPVLIVFLAAVVLVIALAIFLPMWSMASLMG